MLEELETTPDELETALEEVEAMLEELVATLEELGTVGLLLIGKISQHERTKETMLDLRRLSGRCGERGGYPTGLIISVLLSRY